MKRVAACLLALALTLPVWIDKQMAPWLPGSYAWGWHEMIVATGPANGYFRMLAVQALGPEVGNALIIREIPGAVDGDVNAYAGGSWDGRYFVTLENLQWLPLDSQAIIFLHEVGHINQYLSGTRAGLSGTEEEVDAEAFAARWACRSNNDVAADRVFWQAVTAFTSYLGYDHYHPAPIARVDAMEREWHKAGCSRLQSP